MQAQGDNVTPQDIGALLESDLVEEHIGEFICNLLENNSVPGNDGTSEDGSTPESSDRSANGGAPRTGAARRDGGPLSYLKTVETLVPFLATNGRGSLNVQPCPIIPGECRLTDDGLSNLTQISEKAAKFIQKFLKDPYADGDSDMVLPGDNPYSTKRFCDIKWLQDPSMMTVCSQIWILCHVLVFFYKIGFGKHRGVLLLI
jgi:hypothetical protein